MDSLPYVDTLFKEYLLFRGFTATLQSFAAELAVDRCCGFQAEALCELIFGQLLPQCQTSQLMDLLDLLADRLYSQLDGRFEPLVERMEIAIIKAALVTCVKSSRLEKVAEFFRLHGDSLLSGPQAGVWRQWAVLAFVPSPRKDPAFQAYFSSEWMRLLEVSFRNFLSQVLAALPLPAVLRFNADRRHRLALQQQVDKLQKQLAAAQADAAVATATTATTTATTATASTAVVDSRDFPGESIHTTSSSVTKTTTVGCDIPHSKAQLPGGRSPATIGTATNSGAAAPPIQASSVALPPPLEHPHPHLHPLPLEHPLPHPLPWQPTGAPAQQQQEQQPQYTQQQPPPSPSNSLARPQHHGRTLSLETWREVATAADNGNDGSDTVAATTVTAATAATSTVGITRGSGGAGGGNRSGASFVGLESRALRVEPPMVASTNDGACRRSPTAVTAVPPALWSTDQNTTAAAVLLPLLSEDATPLSSSIPLLPSSLAAAVSGGVCRPPLIRNEDSDPDLELDYMHGAATQPGKDCRGASDSDVEEEEVDPAVMLVSGPTAVFESGGAGSGGSKGASDSGQSHRTDVEEGDEGEREAEEDEKEGGWDKEEGAQDDGRVIGVEAGVAVDGETAPTASRISRLIPVLQPPQHAPQSHSGGGSGSWGGGSGGAGRRGSAVVGGGRWQGVTTYTAAPGVLHGRGAAVLAAQFSPGSGQNVATGAADGSVAIWSTCPSSTPSTSSSPRDTRLPSCGAPVTCVAWDARADKIMLVGKAGRGIIAWHADTKRMAAEIQPDPTAPWVSDLACSRKDPVFIVAAATAPPPGSRVVAVRLAAAALSVSAAPSGSTLGGTAATRAARANATGLAVPHPSQRILSSSSPPAYKTSEHRYLSTSPPRGNPGGVGGSSARSVCSSSSSSSGRLSLWNMRAFKRISSYSVPQNTPVLGLAFNTQSTWFAASTCCGDVHLYDSSSSGNRSQPLGSFRANSTAGTANIPVASAPAAVQVYDSAAETVLVTCCCATVRLWSLRRLSEPLLSVPLLPYLPYGGASGGGWSPDWSPCITLGPRSAAAAVVLGGGGPAVYVVDLLGDGADEAAASGAVGGSGGSWLSGLLGSTATTSSSRASEATAASRRAVAAVTAAGRISVILPYSGGSGSKSKSSISYSSMSDVEEEWVYGTSCSWHPTRDVLVVGYSDGAVQTVGLAAALGGSGSG